MRSKAKVRVLNPNLGSKFSYEQWEEIFTNFQKKAALLKWYILVHPIQPGGRYDPSYETVLDRISAMKNMVLQLIRF